jgi:hypothetical protein
MINYNEKINKKSYYYNKKKVIKNICYNLYNYFFF